jgi:hypothetical protein
MPELEERKTALAIANIAMKSELQVGPVVVETLRSAFPVFVFSSVFSTGP